MKLRIFCSVLLGLLAFNVSADTQSKSVLDAMTSKMASYKSYEIQFVLEMDGEFAGRIIVSGDKYFIDTEGMEVFSDGKVKYTYSLMDDEVILENADRTETDFLLNPSLFFKQDYGAFTHISKGSSTIGGRIVEVVELRPNKADSGISLITLYIDASTKLPVQLTTDLEQTDARSVIKINKITPNVTVTPSMFTFDKSKHIGVEVIDFR